jgi:hypothetical protein
MVAALACAAVFAIAPATANATPVQWTLNATVTNGAVIGTAIGSFVYDADTNLYSSVAITTTLPAASFDTSDIVTGSATFLELIDNFVPGANANKPAIGLLFFGGLTNLGGVRTLLGQDGLCTDDGCAFVFTVENRVVVGGAIGGEVTAPSAVPEPATLFLCSAGLIGAGVRRWRQRHA